MNALRVDQSGARLCVASLLHPDRYSNRWEQGKVTEQILPVVREQLRIHAAHVRKPADQRGFAVIPRRWAVERTFAWLIAHRHLARDYECDPALPVAMIRWAAINTITRRIARGGPATRRQRRTFTAIS